MSRKAPEQPKTSDPVSRRRAPSEGDGRSWYEVQGPRPLNVDGALRRRGRPFQTSDKLAASYGDALKKTDGGESEYKPSSPTPTATVLKSKPGAKD